MFCQAINLFALVRFSKYKYGKHMAREMADKFTLENCWMLRFIFDCYKDQKICDNVVCNYYHGLEFVLNC